MAERTTTKSTPSPQLGFANSSQPDLFVPETLTSEISETCGQAISKATPNAISSPASECGASPCAPQDGPTIDPSGPEAAPANLSARQASEAGLLTSGTYGLRSSISSESAALQTSLANRLRARTASLGSTLYKLTWKERVTPSGRSIPALRASVRRTSGKGSTSQRSGWPTPCVVEPNTSPEKVWGRKQRLTEKTGVYRGNDCGLGSKVHLAGWPTSTARDWRSGKSNLHGKNSRPRNEVAELAGWPTTRETDGEKNVRSLEGSLREIERKGCPQDLAQAAAIAGPARLTASGEQLTGSSAGMESGGRLSPRHSLWLMVGPFAIYWLAAAERVTRSPSRSRKRAPSKTESLNSGVPGTRSTSRKPPRSSKQQCEASQ